MPPCMWRPALNRYKKMQPHGCIFFMRTDFIINQCRLVYTGSAPNDADTCDRNRSAMGVKV